MGLAVLCATAAMVLLLDSWVIPFIFLAGIGITILYNLGSNLFFGEISYITKALAAVLQLAVTMDYSIFLWHSFEEEQDLQDSKEDAMAAAIRHTIASRHRKLCHHHSRIYRSVLHELYLGKGSGNRHGKGASCWALSDASPFCLP